MPSVRLDFDARGAQTGAQQFSRGAQQIRRSATAAVRAVRELNAAQRGQGAQGTAGQVQRVQRETSALRQQQQIERQLAADRQRAAREQSRADVERLRTQQQAERGLARLLSLQGGAFRAIAQRTQQEQLLNQAVRAGLVTEQARAAIQASIIKNTTTQAVNSRDLRRNIAGLNANFGQLSRTLSVLTFGPLSGVGARLISVQAAAQAGGLAFAGFAVAAAGLTAALASVARAGEQAERSQLRLEGVIRATSGAVGLTAERIDDISRQIALSTLASTQGVREAAAQLLTFRSIAGESFERTLSLAQDLAELGFGSIQSATVQLAKALEDPAANLSNLRRVGISVSASQRELIQTLSEAGRTAEAQAELFGILEKQIGGTGEAAAGGLAGAWDTATENLTAYLEQANEAISLTNRLANAIQAFNSGFPGPTADTRTPQERLADVTGRLQRERELLAGFESPLTQTPGGGPPLAVLERRNALLREQREIIAEIRRETEARVRGEQEQEALRVENLAAAFRDLRRELDPTVKAEEDFEAAQRTINAAIEAGVEGAAELGPALLRMADDARRSALGLDDTADAADRAAEAQRRFNEALSERESERVERVRSQLVDAVGDAQREAARAAEETDAAAISKPFENAAENVQRAWGDAFFDIFRHGVDSTEDLADAMLDILARLAAEAATLLLFEPVFVAGTGTNVRGAGSLASLFGAGGSARGGLSLPDSLGIDRSEFPLLLGDSVEEGARLGTEAGILDSAGELATTIGGAVASAAAGVAFGSGQGTAAQVGGGVSGLVGNLLGNAVGGPLLGQVGGLVAGLAGTLVGPAVETAFTVFERGIRSGDPERAFQGIDQSEGAFRGASVGFVFAPDPAGVILGALIGAQLAERPSRSAIGFSTVAPGTPDTRFAGATVESPFGELRQEITSGPIAETGFARRYLESLAAFDQAIADQLDPDEIARVASAIQDLGQQGFVERTPQALILRSRGLTFERAATAVRELEGAGAEEAFARPFPFRAPGSEQLNERLGEFFRVRDAFQLSLRTLAGEEIPRLEQAVTQLENDFARARVEAEEFGLDVDALTESFETGRAKLATDFLEDTQRAILSFTDPLAAALQEQAQEAERRLANARIAEAEGAAGAILEVERLNGLERARLIEETTRQANAPLNALLEDLRTGDLGGRSLAGRLSDAQAQFEQARALAFDEPANAAARADFADAARQLVELNREQFASSAPFFESARFIEQSLVALRDTPITGADISLPEGASTSALQQEANGEMREMRRALERLLVEAEETREQDQQTQALLREFLARLERLEARAA